MSETAVGLADAAQDTSMQLQVADPSGLLNKYALPKVAMVTIAVAAGVGCWLTVGVGAGMGPAAAAASYLLLMATGTAAGGLFWHWYVAEPARRLVDGPEADEYAERQLEIFRGIEAWAWPLAALGLAWLLSAYGTAGAGSWWLPGLAVACLAAWLAGLLARRGHRGGVRASLLSLPAVAGLLVSAGWLQVWHDMPGDWVLLGWRALHLFAFAAWFGGAVWNVAIAVRAARRTLTVPVVLTAHMQLERFRRVVRIALPLILLTGLLQLHDFFGWDARAAASGAFGHLVLIKLGLIALLVVIFNTCPMWHACSPIAGMCSLDDLGLDGSGAPSGAEEL